METERIEWALGVGLPFLVATIFLTAWLFCWLLDNRMVSVEKNILATINGKAASRREKNRARRKRRKERQRAQRQFDPRSQLGARNGDP